MNTSTFPLSTRARAPEPRNLVVLEVIVVIAVVVYLGWAIAESWDQFIGLLPSLAPWLLFVALADLSPIPVWGTVELTTSFPVLLAAAFVFPSYAACLLGFLGPVDRRELRREISPTRGLYNRANIAVSVLAASIVFDSANGSVDQWPAVVGAALLALLADFVVNASLLTAGIHLLTGEPGHTILRNVYGGYDSLRFMLAYASFGLLAVVLASVYSIAGAWGLVPFLLPVILAQQMFVHWKHAGEAADELRQTERALVSVSERIADERRDERLQIAAGLHDEVLPPLYKVHLMGQVLRQDLDAGRLLELEDDLPELLTATEAANSAVRVLIRNLRQSALGTRGLAAALRLLGRELESKSESLITVEVDDDVGPPLIQLVAYHVAREALRNAVRHSGASAIRLVLVKDGSDLRLVCEDDGCGFSPGLVDATEHFGLELMRERVELMGGQLIVVSRPGEGTLVAARIPMEPVNKS